MTVKSPVHCWPRTNASARVSTAPGRVQRALLPDEAVLVEVAGLVDGDAAEERDPVRVGVVHRDLERAERELPRPGRLVARDHVGHVVGDEHRRLQGVVTRVGEVVAITELDVRAAERALGQVVERAEAGGELGRVIFLAHVLGDERGLGDVRHDLVAEPHVVGQRACRAVADRARAPA